MKRAVTDKAVTGKTVTNKAGSLNVTIEPIHSSEVKRAAEFMGMGESELVNCIIRKLIPQFKNLEAIRYGRCGAAASICGRKGSIAS